MKKWLLFSMLLGSVLNSGAQIEFEHNVSWSQVKEIARKENKMIFLDAYATWCGPCKWMSANVFTDKSVGNFYNERFVNYKLDMEKGEGPELAKKLGVSAYPTLLFLDKNGELVHRVVGSRDVDEFIENGRNALDPDKQFYTLLKRYEAGERSNDFLFKMAGASKEASADNSAQIIGEYLKTVPKTEWMNPENTDFVLMSANRFDSEAFQYVLENRDAYPDESFQYAVSQCIDGEFMQAVNNEDEPAMRKLQQNVKAYMGEDAAAINEQVELKFYELTGNEAKLEEAERRILNNSNDWNMLNEKAWEYYQNESDAAKLKLALGWAKRSVELEENFYNTDTYARLLQKTGNKKDALKWANRAVELGKQSGEDVSEAEALVKQLKK